MLRYTFPTKIMFVVLTLNWVVQNFETYFTGQTIHERRGEIVVVFNHDCILANAEGSTFQCFLQSVTRFPEQNRRLNYNVFMSITIGCL